MTSQSDEDTSKVPAISTVGLSEVYCPSGSANVDIVFIHGFTGHPERTWTHKGQEPSAKRQKLMLGSRSARSDVYWPRDLVPGTVPQARVLTFGYDTHIRGPLSGLPNANTVYDIAWNLLVALEARRRSDPTRRLLFIVHSLGGIVVKEMLRRSSGTHHTHLQTIVQHTSGLIFFGTPHGGADPRSLLRTVAERVIKTLGFSVNQQIVDTLLPSSERLRELRDDFGPLAQARGWSIHSFQESLGLRALNGQKVVEDVSSSLNLPLIEVCEHIDRDHREMCRFSGGPEDHEYVKIAAALRRLCDFPAPPQTKVASPPPLDAVDRKAILENLAFEQMDARHLTIRTAHAKTCRWFLKSEDYSSWLAPDKLSDHHGFLWLKGKAGSGKSTLMKFLFAKGVPRGWDAVSFFYNARGAELEHQTMGLYRSLLHQLLDRYPFILTDLSASGHAALKSQGWILESLKSILHEVIPKLGNVKTMFFVDALDECPIDQVRDMISFFESIGEATFGSDVRFLVCFSSRHYPHVSINKSLEVILEGNEAHAQDIANYLHTELKVKPPKLAAQLREDIQAKASGIFMWVVLVTDIINQEFDDGRCHNLRKRLHDIPANLHELFRDILTRDTRHQAALILCIQWVLYAKEPLTPEQLYFAILAGVDHDAPQKWDRELVTKEDLERFLLSSSKGLTEITKTKQRKVQFIHESVRDFLLKDGGLGKVWPDISVNFEGMSHESLKQCCLKLVLLDRNSICEPHDLSLKASSDEAKALRASLRDNLPFLEYATGRLLFHANEAARTKISQISFVQSFPAMNWYELHNVFEKHEVRKYSSDTSLLYIAAEQDLPDLVCNQMSMASMMQVGRERRGLPLLAAIACGSAGIVREFVRLSMAESVEQMSGVPVSLSIAASDLIKSRTSLGFEYHVRAPLLNYPPQLENLLRCLWQLEAPEEVFLVVLRGDGCRNCEDVNVKELFLEAARRQFLCLLDRLIRCDDVPSGWNVRVSTTIMGEVESWNTALLEATEAGRTQTITWLLRESSKLSETSHSSHRSNLQGWKALSLAVTSKNESIIELLLSNGSYWSDDLEKRRMFRAAISHGEERIVTILLRHPATALDPNEATDLLEDAARRGTIDILKLLLERGAHVDGPIHNIGAPLRTAVEVYNTDIVRLLLEHGADPNACTSSPGHALQLAAQSTFRIDSLQLLLGHGAKVEALDTSWSPLLLAIEGSSADAVNMLLNHGALPVESSASHALLVAAINARREDDEKLKVLLEHGADPMAADADGSALAYAELYGTAAQIQLLQQYSAHATSSSLDASMDHTAGSDDLAI